MSKPIYQSKTFYFNLAMLAVTVAGALPPKYGVPIASVGNILLRFLTDSPVTVTGA